MDPDSIESVNQDLDQERSNSTKNVEFSCVGGAFFSTSHNSGYRPNPRLKYMWLNGLGNDKPSLECPNKS